MLCVFMHWHCFVVNYMIWAEFCFEKKFLFLDALFTFSLFGCSTRRLKNGVKSFSDVKGSNVWYHSFYKLLIFTCENENFISKIQLVSLGSNYENMPLFFLFCSAFLSLIKFCNVIFLCFPKYIYLVFVLKKKKKNCFVICFGVSFKCGPEQLEIYEYFFIFSSLFPLTYNKKPASKIHRYKPLFQFLFTCSRLHFCPIRKSLSLSLSL